MKPRRFQQVDVFTAVPYMGNPVAVVLDGDELDDEAMQRFARWTNLSETTFVLSPTDSAADYRLRIYTPGGELPFAGHPTLGSCHAWLDAGGTPKNAGHVVQQCGVGLVKIRRGAGTLAFEAPACRQSAPDVAVLAEAASALGIDAAHIVASQVLDNGPVWLGLLLDEAALVDGLQPDHRALKRANLKIGVAAKRAAGSGSGADLVVRAFAAPIGVDEDPVTGSLNASLAQWLIGSGRMPARYTASQGRAMGRDGIVTIDSDASGGVRVGGASVTCISGTVRC